VSSTGIARRVRSGRCGGRYQAPLVRHPGMNPSAAQWALDLGAHGIVVPRYVMRRMLQQLLVWRSTRP